MGRGPKATISFTYCMARPELKAGGEPVSVGFCGASMDAVEGEASFGAIAASLSRAHAANVIPKIKQKIPASRKVWLRKIIVPFAAPAPCAVSDAPGKRCRYLPCKARPC